MKEFSKSTAAKVLLGVSVFVLVVGLALAGYLLYYKYYLSNPKTVAKVGEVKITREDLKNQIYSAYLDGTPEKPKEVPLEEKIQLTNYLVEVEIARQYDAKNNISVSDEDVQKSIDASFGDNWGAYDDTQRTAIKRSHKNALYIKKAKESMLGYREGEFVLFRFDKYIEYADVEKIDGTGEKDKIAAQRKYAETLAADISGKLKAGQLTFDQAKNLVGSDTTIGVPGFAPYHPGIYGSFDKNQFGEGLGYFDTTAYKGFREGVLTKGKGETTEPFILQGTTGTNFADIALVIAKIDTAGGGNTYSYTEWLISQKESLPVKIYIGAKPWGGKTITFSNVLRVKTANACTASYAGSHRTNITLYMYKKDATNNDIPFDPGNVVFTAGDNDMLVYNSSCGSPTHQYSVTKNDSSGGVIGLNNSADGSPALIDCDRTAAASINLPDASSLGGGHWDVDLSTATYAAWYKGFNSSTGLMTLDLSTSNNWANGDNVQKKVVYTPSYTVTYNHRPYLSYWVNGVETNEANQGDLVHVSLHDYNEGGVTIPEIYVRDNIANNVYGGGNGAGTAASPYNIRQVAGGSTKDDINTVCTTTACGLLQGAGYYGTDTINQLQWRYRSTNTTGLAAGDRYELDFYFKINSAAPGTIIANRFCAFPSATAAVIGTTSKCSNIATLRIRDDATLRVRSNPAAGGTISGAPHRVSGVWYPDTITDQTDATETFTIGEATRVSYTANTPDYVFSGWSAIPGYNCPISGMTQTQEFNMASSYGCQANFTQPPSLSCNVVPSQGPAALIVTINASPQNIASPIYDYDIDYNGTTFMADYFGKSSPFLHTYKESGSYQVRVRENSTGLFANCNPVIRVTDPTSNNGGEVAP